MWTAVSPMHLRTLYKLFNYSRVGQWIRRSFFPANINFGLRGRKQWRVTDDYHFSLCLRNDVPIEFTLVWGILLYTLEDICTTLRLHTPNMWNILTSYEECAVVVLIDREVYHNAIKLNFDSLLELLASNSIALGSVRITSDYYELGPLTRTPL